MNVAQELTRSARERVASALAEAGERMGPVWPLDRFVAVNPFLGFSGVHFAEGCARIAATAHSQVFMPPAYYREQEVSAADLDSALNHVRMLGISEWSDLVADLSSEQLMSAQDVTDRDAAPSGQRRGLPNTQGGADACPGLSDIAPAGLNLAPLGPEGDPALVCFFDSPNGQTCIRVTQDDDWHSQVLENPAHAGRLDSVVRTPQDLFAIQTVRDENPHIVSRCVKGGEWRILPSPSPTSPPSHLAIFDDRLVAGLDDEKRGFSLWWTKIPANGESPEWEPILLDGAGRTLMSGNLVSLGVRGSALDVVAGVTDPERAAFLQRTFKESRFDYLRVYADGDWDVVMGAPRFSVRGLRVPLANRSFEQWSNPHHPRWSAGAAGIFLCVDTDIGTQVMRSGDGETWEPAWSEFISGTFQRFAPQTIGQNPGGPVIVAETSDFSDHQVLQIWLGEPAHQISSPPAGLSS